MSGVSVMRNQPRRHAGRRFRGRLRVPQYPFNTETANIWRRSVVPSARSSNHFFFVSCLPAGVFPLRCLLFVSSRCHGRNVGRIMTKKGSCQPLFERTWGLSFFFAPFCHAQPSPAPSRLVFLSTNLEDAIQLAMVHAAMCVRDAGASSAICVACALMASGQPHTALNMEGGRC